MFTLVKAVRAKGLTNKLMNIISIMKYAGLVITSLIDFKFPEGKVRIALLEDEEGVKIVGMRSIPQRKGLRRKALSVLKEKGIVGKPVNIRSKADTFWAKMYAEGLVK